ncbi:MAG: epoxyqueuosine reductase [Clostridia bacterium]|nr:epoxyqueuosine reductase [Clostridia bacterium]
MREDIKSIFLRQNIEYAEATDFRGIENINMRLYSSIGFQVRSAIIFLVPYYVGEGKNMSAYSTSRDYHAYISSLSEILIAELAELFPGYSFRGFGDHSPIDERGAALDCALGVLGENGLLLNEKYGSYVFIGDILTNAPPELLGAPPKSERAFCEGCGACLRACATGILSGEGTACLSEITQRKGTLTDAEVALMRKYNTVWGCDLCQRVCPHNRGEITPIEFFHGDRIDLLTKDKLNSMSDEEFKARAFSWRGRAVVERNLDHLGY